MSTIVRKAWRRVDGVLLLDKPTGLSSNAALQSARRLFSAAKAGHTGTLDPLASGLLPLCFGETTKFSADLFAADKTYLADIVFGADTDTGDAEGLVVRRRPVAFGLPELKAGLARFRGPLRQVPPMYSALKRDGRPLYQLARQGLEVAREAREVVIRELRLIDFAADRCRLQVTCSKGTYIRTLAVDLGNALGCGAHVFGLRRLAVGDLHVADAVTLEQLAVLSEEARLAALRPVDFLLQSLPAVHLDGEEGQRFVHGNALHVGTASGRCRVYGQDRLLGLGEVDEEGRLQPRRVVAAP